MRELSTRCAQEISDALDGKSSALRRGAGGDTIGGRDPETTKDMGVVVALLIGLLLLMVVVFKGGRNSGAGDGRRPKSMSPRKVIISESRNEGLKIMILAYQRAALILLR